MTADATSGPRERPVWTRLARASARLQVDLPIVVLDATLVVAAYILMLALRFDFQVPFEYWSGLWGLLPVLLAVHFGTYLSSGLYGQMWRHASALEARRVLLAGALSTTLVAALTIVVGRRIPLSVGVLGAVGATMLAGIARFQARLFGHRRHAEGSRRVLIVGAGQSGAALIRELHRQDETPFIPVALLDDDPRKRNRSIGGVKVVGPTSQLCEVAHRYDAHQVLLAIPSADAQLVRRIADAAADCGLALKVLPSVAELVNGQVSVGDVRDLSINDLLGRSQVETDLEAVRAIIAGRRVLVTGGGGSIGSEIARQVAALQPERLVILDRDETHLFDAAARIHDCDVVQVLADIRDERIVRTVFRRERPDIVFHAAAHKHVPLLENHPCEAVTVNVLGTRNVVRAAKEVDVERFVFISTDKAVRPRNVMGASKRLGEQIVLLEAPWDRHYCAVRFGNVLGSRGSVVPTFVRQIRDGGPVTLTHPDVTRFFMSVEEAVQLVLQAAAISHGREIFMLDMGEPVRIVDLAHRMISLAGRRVGVDIDIDITGLRPGEKMAEDLRAPDEPVFPTPHASILALYPRTIEEGVLEKGLTRLERITWHRDDEKASALLFELATRSPSVVHLPRNGRGATRHHRREPAWTPSSTSGS